MRKSILILSITFLLIQMGTTLAYASGLLDKFGVRITVIENGTIHEWEFDSPDKYEYETGEQVFRGETAKKEVSQMMSLLSLNENAKIENMIGALQERFPNIEHFDARFVDANGQLYTWVWSADK